MQASTYAAAGSAIRHSPRAQRARKKSKNEPKCEFWTVYATMTGINASEMCSCTLDMTYDVARFWGAINRWVRRLWRSAVAGTGDLKYGLFSLCKTLPPTLFLPTSSLFVSAKFIRLVRTTTLVLLRGCGEGWANHFSVHARKESMSLSVGHMLRN
jgi:hypothetical protein